MRMTRGRKVLLTLYVAVVSFAGGVMSERIRFDHERAAMLHRYGEAVREWHQLRMATEGAGSGGARPEAR